jgi:DNA repair protein RadC
MMQDLDVEEFWALLMNQHYRLIKKVRISRGGITETPVDVRIIMKEAVLANCTILAVCHNHPSGNLSPSHADKDLTRSIKRACELLNIYFLDHVIITDGQYYSFKEQGQC